MEQSLAYLREIVSNYTDDHSDCERVYSFLQNNSQSVEDFVSNLSAKEIDFLNSILPEEIKYAKDEKDDIRAEELNKVFEQLY